MKHSTMTPLISTGRGRLVFFLIVLIVSIALSGCRKGPLLTNLMEDLSKETPTQTQDTSSHEQRYLAAIEDAKIAEPEEIVTTLTPITSYNKDLTWDKGRVLMATWTDYDGYSGKDGQIITLKQDVWVTVSQEMRLECLAWKLDDEALNMRLRQLLGLPPDAPYDRVAEFWVRPDDLFRPSPDPEITDREAGLDYPGPIRTVRVATSHKRWMNRNTETSYGENGYPWTRLGYTYDWGNPDSEVGLSEYVIRKGAKVIVRSSWPTADYCSDETKQ